MGEAQRGGMDELARHRQVEEIIGELGGGYWDLIENSRYLIQSVNPEGMFFYVNKTWRDTLGYSTEEAKRLSFMDVMHPDCLEHCMNIFKDLMEGKSYSRVECELVAKDGTVISLEGNVSCHFKDGKPVATRGFFKNLTSPERYEEEDREISEDLCGFSLEEVYLEFHDLVTG
jgi:PAS domain S-box-containing protein